MSHVVDCKLSIPDTPDSFAVLQRVARRLGLGLRQDNRYRWFGRWVNDYSAQNAAMHRFDPKQFGKNAKFVLSLQGDSTAYELGLVPDPDNPGNLVPIYDFYGINGRALERVIGKEAGLFSQAWQIERAKLQAEQMGHKVKETRLKDGTIELTVVENKQLSKPMLQRQTL